MDGHGDGADEEEGCGYGWDVNATKTANSRMRPGVSLAKVIKSACYLI